MLWIKKGNASVWNSYFVQNNADQHGGVIFAKYSSHINITKSTFLRNEAGTSAGVISCNTGPKVFVSDSIMKHNSANVCGMILIGSLSVIEISFCQIQENVANFLARTLCAYNSSFILKSSFFKGNTIYFGGSFGIIGSADYLAPSMYLVSSTGYLENCTLIENQRINAGVITLSASELRLSKTVFLQNITEYSVVIDTDSVSKFINRIYTYKSEMIHGNMNLKSDTSNYKQIAIKEHFLQKFTETNLVYLFIEETQFASSEFSVLKSISFFLFCITFNLFYLLTLSIYHRFEGVIVSSLFFCSN